MIEHENALHGRNDTVNYIEAIYSKLCKVLGGQTVERLTSQGVHELGKCIHNECNKSLWIKVPAKYINAVVPKPGPGVPPAVHILDVSPNWSWSLLESW